MVSAHKLLALAWLPLALGCSKINPEVLAARPPSVAARWTQPVSVTAVHAMQPLQPFNVNTLELIANRDAFSDELARLLRDSLKNAGGALAPGHKTLEVQVVYLDFMFGGPCLLDFNTRLGNGEFFGLQTFGSSRIYEDACRVAFEAAVQAIVSDNRTVAYMNDVSDEPTVAYMNED